MDELHTDNSPPLIVETGRVPDGLNLMSHFPPLVDNKQRDEARTACTCREFSRGSCVPKRLCASISCARKVGRTQCASRPSTECTRHATLKVSSPFPPSPPIPETQTLVRVPQTKRIETLKEHLRNPYIGALNRGTELAD